MRIWKITILCLLLWGLPHRVAAQSKADPESLSSVRQFVQQFYDWYVPKAQGAQTIPAWRSVLERKKSKLSSRLIRALRADSAVQAKSVGEILALDFDPFLNSQDPAPRYEIGSVAHRNSSYWVDINGIWPGKEIGKPDVVAEISAERGHWIFVNFHYPGNRDLLTILKFQREARLKPRN